MNYALPRTSFLAIGVAAAGLFATPTASFAADTKELAALKTALGSSDVAGADPQALADAVVAASVANPKLNIGNIAGEALKYNVDDPGDEIAAELQAAVTDPNALSKAAANAAVRASTKTAANAVNVPDFIASLVNSDEDAYVIARQATKSTTAIGAVVGGRALDYVGGTDAAEVTLAQVAFGDKKLKKAVQQISQYTSINVNDSAAFASSLATDSNVQKVATGVAAGNPTDANDIVDTLINGSLGATVVKQSAKIAKSVGLVADVEQVSLMAETFGLKVTSKAANSTAKALVQAISGRAQLFGSSDGTTDNTVGNKAEEVGEIVATFIATIQQNSAIQPTFTDAKKAASLVFKIAKTMYKAAKVKKIKGIQNPNDLQRALLVKDGNFFASLAYTLDQMEAAGRITSDVLAAISDKLLKSVKSIGGKEFEAQITAALNAGFNGSGVVPGDPNSGFEDGVNIGPVVDPETDTRNS